MPIADRYLSKLGIEGPITPDLATLQTLLEAHLRTIPFENLTSFLGSSVSLVPEECFNKLLNGRGGYCMEHALLSRTALAELGYKTSPRFARVLLNSGKVLAQTHTVTIVHLDAEEYIFDPGFGGYTPSSPIRISDRGEQGKWNKYRLREAPAGISSDMLAEDMELVYESEVGGKWTPMYALTGNPVIPADIEAFNFYVCKFPQSIFVTSVMASAWDGERRVTGFNRFWKRRNGEEVEEGEIRCLEDTARWLRREMGLVVDDGIVEGVWKKLQEVHPLEKK